MLDVAGRLKRVTDPNGHATTYTYWNAAQDGRLKQVTRPKVGSFTAGRITRFDYDALGRVIQLTEQPAAGSGETARDTLRKL